MKEIKFKAYIKKLKKVYDVIDISWIYNSKELWVTIQRDKDTGECFTFPKDGHLIEFTGFKDKNGREAYFGDLEKFPSETFTDDTFEICWDTIRGRIFLHYLDKKGTSRFLMDAELIPKGEIVGSIYEASKH